MSNLIPFLDLSDVRWLGVAKDCQRYAVRCLQDARTTVDPRQKIFLVEMAQAWQRRAERERHMPETVTSPFLSWIAATDCLLVPDYIIGRAA
jgi:hypothetical protein